MVIDTDAFRSSDDTSKAPFRARYRRHTDQEWQYLRTQDGAVRKFRSFSQACRALYSFALA